jgi:hypothetical protein
MRVFLFFLVVFGPAIVWITLAIVAAFRDYRENQKKIAEENKAPELASFLNAEDYKEMGARFERLEINPPAWLRKKLAGIKAEEKSLEILEQRRVYAEEERKKAEEDALFVEEWAEKKAAWRQEQKEYGALVRAEYDDLFVACGGLIDSGNYVVMADDQIVDAYSMGLWGGRVDYYRDGDYSVTRTTQRLRERREKRYG